MIDGSSSSPSTLTGISYQAEQHSDGPMYVICLPSLFMSCLIVGALYSSSIFSVVTACYSHWCLCEFSDFPKHDKVMSY